MHIEIYPTHNQVPDGILKNKNIVLIDVLRATSVITTALANGANKVMTTHSFEDALDRKTKNPNLLLGGERNTIKIEGFDFGNSPLEYTKDKILNKTILLSTSNGTQAVKKAMDAKIMIAASFLNLNSVVDFMEKTNEDFIVISSGTNGHFSLDDGLCAGLIFHELRKRQSILTTTDFGELLSLPFGKDSYSLTELLSNTFHLNYLKSKGFTADVDYCLSINQLNLIPIWKMDGFIPLKDF